MILIAIGAVGGILVVYGCEILDQKLHIDDPVRAVGVHCLNGVWEHLRLVICIQYPASEGTLGLFFGGGTALLITPIDLGVIICLVAVWVYSIIATSCLL